MNPTTLFKIPFAAMALVLITSPLWGQEKMKSSGPGPRKRPSRKMPGSQPSHSSARTTRRSS